MGKRKVELGWRELTFPRDFDQDQATAFGRTLAMRPLHGLLRQPDPLVCELVATPGRVRWLLGMTGREAAMVGPQMRAQLPGVGVTPAERGLPGLAWAIELRLDSATRPLRTDAAEGVAAAVLTAMAGVYRDEALVLSWVVGPWLPRPAVETGQPAGLWGPPLEANEAAAFRAKLEEPVLGTVGRIGVRAAGPPRQAQLVQRVLGALELTRAAGVGIVTRNVPGERAARRLAEHRGPLWEWPCPLNAAELACVIGWPIGAPYVEGVAYRGHRQLPAVAAHWVPADQAAAAPGRFRVLGRATLPGRDALVHLPVRDALHHLHVVGPTGSGKSVLLARLIEADIAAGRSVVVVEPKTDLIAAVADRIPAERVDDVVLVDPTDRDSAVGLHVLGGPDPELAADRLVHVLRNLYRDSWGPRTNQVLYNGALTLARAGETLAELPHLFTRADYRDRVLERAPDPLGTAPFWEWFGGLSDAERTAVIGPSLNRLGEFVGRRAIRAIVGQTDPRFALAQVFTERRVLLVNLAKGIVGPDAARLLGALVLSQLWQAALGRAAVPAQRRHPVMVYVDEFQDYAAGLPLDFGDVLSQARGLGLGLTVAHQGLHQLDPTTRAGVLTNARSRLVFQTTGPDVDVRALASALGGDLTPADVAALGAFEAYASLLHGHAVMRPASLVTLPAEPGLGATEPVRERSRDQWAQPVTDVEAAILARRQTPRTGPLGGRRRSEPQS